MKTQFSSMKVLNHWETLGKIAKGEPTYPICCEIDPSNICNHQCSFCFFPTYRQEKQVLLDKGIMLNVIKELAQLGVKAVVFTGGGEPLCNKDTMEAIQLANKEMLDVGLVTNGGLLRERYEGIVDNCKFIRISLDAGTPETHDLLHRPRNGKFDEILYDIGMLVRARKENNSPLVIGCAFVVHPYNCKEIVKFTQECKSFGVDYVQIRPVFLPGMTLSKETWEEARKQIVEAKKLETDKFSVCPIMHRFDEVETEEKTFTKCLGHNLIGVIGADASIYLCCQWRGDKRFILGSLKEKTFKEIWESEERQKVIRRINVEECFTCRYSPYNAILEYLADEKEHVNFL